MADYGRVSSSIGEAAVTMPTTDAVGRVSSSIGEAAVTEDAFEARVTYILIEVFAQNPIGTEKQRPPFGDGLQGENINKY